ncbi:MAG: hypothetical protein A4E57_04637 [Syntrophorhabdaceae bacterium PtaU1.Bin034]|nr:MAG: hypothetical protein A4E57_04637 [Syntrophorhabdaceae bacterium PtaU1.Bin034]
MGDTFVLSLGVEESRNGPFYDAVVLGKSIVKKGDFGLPPEPERMGGHIVIPTGQNMFARFMATAPGDGSITIREKQGRTDTPHEIEKIALKVFGTASIGALQELGGNALQLYSAGDYFTCATPSNWYRITDPAGNRKIFGVSAYETGQDDRLSVKMSIEFYPPDNALGYRTADEFIRSQLRKGALRAKSGMPDNVFETTVAGRKARTFERDIFIVGKTATLFFSKKVPLVERFIVVPATAGFYVLEFRTPLNDFAKNDQLFNAIINSFVPLR